jgi:hypothetical protein
VYKSSSSRLPYYIRQVNIIRIISYLRIILQLTYA